MATSDCEILIGDVIDWARESIVFGEASLLRGEVERITPGPRYHVRGVEGLSPGLRVGRKKRGIVCGDEVQRVRRDGFEGVRPQEEVGA